MLHAKQESHAALNFCPQDFEISGLILFLGKVEQKLQRQHLGRLRKGLVESIETSNIHQETLRALKQINTSFSMIEHPILKKSGDLLESRLA